MVNNKKNLFYTIVKKNLENENKVYYFILHIYKHGLHENLKFSVIEKQLLYGVY